MIPLAIGFASYLKKYDRLVLNMAGIVLAIYVAATCTVIVPQCQQASAYDAAQVVSGLADNETAVVTYGGRYPVSLTNHPKVLAVVRDRDEAHFLQEVPGNWKWRTQKGIWAIYQKEADL